MHQRRQPRHKTNLPLIQASECTKFVCAEAWPGVTPLRAHNFKIMPVHCDFLTYGHSDFRSYHGVLFYNVNKFTEFYVSSFTSFNMYCRLSLYDVLITHGCTTMPPPNLVWNKCCLNYKISWIFATRGLLQPSECTKFVFCRGYRPLSISYICVVYAVAYTVLYLCNLCVEEHTHLYINVTVSAL